MNPQSSEAPPPFRAFVWLCVFLTLAAALQGILGGIIPRSLGQPDLLLTLGIVAGLLSDATTGGIVGLSAGLLTASLVGETVGSYLVSRTLAGFVGGWTTNRLYRGNFFVVVPGVFILSLAAELVYLLAAPRIGLSHGLKSMLLGAADNAILSAPILFILRRCGWGTRL